MKTVKEWLETLEEPARSLALGYCDPRDLGFECGNMAFALGAGFIWEETKEGNAYWADLVFGDEMFYENIKNKQDLN